MVKTKADKRPPSRKRYDEEHPTISLRLDRATHEELREHLKSTGRSAADFVKDAMGKEKSMIADVVQDLASRQVDTSI